MFFKIPSISDNLWPPGDSFRCNITGFCFVAFLKVHSWMTVNKKALLDHDHRLFSIRSFPFGAFQSQHASTVRKVSLEGHLDDSVDEYLPLAQVVIPGSWDPVPHQAPCMEPASQECCCFHIHLSCPLLWEETKT